MKIIFFFIFLYILPYSFAANSESYSLDMFTLGLQAETPNNTTLNTRSLLTAFQSTSNNASSLDIRSNIGFLSAHPSSPPIILSHKISPSPATPSSIIRLNLSATNVRSLWATIAKPDTSTELISLTNGENYYYESTTDTGTYTVIFYANNSQGATTSITDSFIIASPSTGSSLGSGGEPSQCTYVWNCSEWTDICTEGKQTRTCTNEGTCSGEKGKPKEERLCTTSLFDLKIDIENLNISKEKDLNFKVHLKEIKNIPLVDVFIEYKILSDKGEVLYKEEETKAISGEAFFEKIIPYNFEDGSYTLSVMIEYGKNQTAVASKTFTIEGEKMILEEEKVKNNSELFVLFGVSLILLIFVFLIIKKKRKQKESHTKYQKEQRKMQRREEGEKVTNAKGKRVYTENGSYIGKIREVILAASKVEFLIALQEHHKIQGKNHILITMDDVLSYSDIIIIRSRIEKMIDRNLDK